MSNKSEMERERDERNTRVHELEDNINTIKQQIMTMLMGEEEGKGKGKGKADGEKDGKGTPGIAGCLATLDWVTQDRERFAAETDKVLARIRANLLGRIDYAADMRKAMDPLIQEVLKYQNYYNGMVSEDEHLQMFDEALKDALEKKATAMKDRAQLKAKDSKKARLSQ